MPWEVFVRESARRTIGPTVTIRRSGTLSLNSAAVGLVFGADETPKRSTVELLYDRARGFVGFRRASPENRNSHLLRRQYKSDKFLVSGRRFCAHYDISTAVARRYRAKLCDGVLMISLADRFANVTRGAKDLESGAPLSVTDHAPLSVTDHEGGVDP